RLPSFCSYHVCSLSELYTLSLHDALPICISFCPLGPLMADSLPPVQRPQIINIGDPWSYRTTRCKYIVFIFKKMRPDHCPWDGPDRKSTRLNSSHVKISYAVFCLKKKKDE